MIQAAKRGSTSRRNSPDACPSSMTRCRIANASRTSPTCACRCWLRATSRTMTVTSAGSFRHVRRRIFAMPSSFFAAGSSDSSTVRKRTIS